MEILLTIALFIAFFWLLRQEKALGKYAQSTTLFTRAVDQYQEAVEGYQEAIAKYEQAIELYEQDLAECELLLKEHGIDKSKLKAEPTQQLIPPPQFTLPDLKATKKQPSNPKGVSKNSPMYKEFLNLLNGNEETANRLITRQQQLNPDRLDNWILEKVIGDLKRDRRA